MITDEERQSIINEAVEKALLTLPEVVSSLIASQTSIIRLSKKFYEQYPEFNNHRDIVSNVVEKMESDNPGVGYEELLNKSIPLIRENIRLSTGLDHVIKPVSRNLLFLKDPLKTNVTNSNGEL